MSEKSPSTPLTSLTSGLSMLALLLAGGCGGAHVPVDGPTAEGRGLERQARNQIRAGTVQGLCDGAALFGSARTLYQQSGNQDLASRGDALVARWAPRCQEQVERFWVRYQGCATPLQGREAETFIFWDNARIETFRGLGMDDIAGAMAEGRSRWQGGCPQDFRAATAGEAQLHAQLPPPVTLQQPAAPTATATHATAPSLDSQAGRSAEPTAVPELNVALVAMAHGQYSDALAELTRLAAQNGATPMIVFNIAVCHDQLGARDQAVAAYQQVALDDQLGPRAQARLAILNAVDQTAAASPAPAPPQATAQSAPQAAQPAPAPAPQAQPAPAAPSPAQAPNQAQSVARQQFERGLALAEAGRLNEAIQAFESSNTAVAHPRTVLNIAISYHRLGQLPVALSHYQRVANDERLDATIRQNIQQTINALSAMQPPPPPAVPAHTQQAPPQGQQPLPPAQTPAQGMPTPLAGTPSLQ